jgi:hypothetical protein
MSEPSPVAFARRAVAGGPRRHSLLALGGAALAAGLAGAGGTAAKRNPVRKVKRKQARRCKVSRERCRIIPASVPNPDAFSLRVLACCEHCFAHDFLTCVFAP